MITCEQCKRVFADQRAFDLHHSYDIKSYGGPFSNLAYVRSPEEVAAKFPERRRCGNDAELAGRGLVNHAWMSVSGLQDAYWTNGPS